MHNIPVLNLPGPDFLNIFGVVVIAVLAAAWIAIRFADRTDRRPPPPVPQNPDAVEVAYLQGGVNQVIRTLVFDLVQRGLATLAKEDRVAPAANRPEPGALRPIERRLYDVIEARPLAHELFADRTLRSAMMAHLEPVRMKLAAEDLIKPESVKIWRTRVQIVGTLILLGLSAAKIYVALQTGHTNVSYLVFLTIASVAALFALAYILTRAHASRRGLAWLENMRLAYKSRLDGQLSQISAPGTKAFEGASLFLIGLYGFSVLKGTSETMFYDAFKRGSSSDGSSCGSSCGGSCGSGDGGGGCGGCGGGD